MKKPYNYHKNKHPVLKLTNNFYSERESTPKKFILLIKVVFASGHIFFCLFIKQLAKSKKKKKNLIIPSTLKMLSASFKYRKIT